MYNIRNTKVEAVEAGSMKLYNWRVAEAKRRREEEDRLARIAQIRAEREAKLRERE